MSGPRLEICLLGDVAVSRNGVKLDLPASKKTRALLAYLVLTERPHTRGHLCDLLWDAPNDPRAELRWSLSKLRHLVDEDVQPRIIADHERVHFESAGSAVDVAEVRGLCKDPLRAARSDLLSAVGLFRGELLEGLELPNAHRFHAWCTGERERLRSIHTSILNALINHPESEANEALSFARGWVAVDPFAQHAHAHVIALLTQLGRGHEAIEHYDVCRKLLARELGIEPGKELQDARRRIRRGVAAVRETSSTQSPKTPSVRTIPLVGRSAQMALIEEAVKSLANGNGRALVLLGDAGIGKTRLLDEFAIRVQDAGGIVLRSRGFEAEMVRAYGVWIDALRAVPANSIEAPLHSRLAALLPELGAAARIEDRHQLFDAVATLISHLATESPIAILFDDVQWIDEASLALLHYMVRELQATSATVAAAAREVELGENAIAAAIVRELRRDPRTLVLQLSGLDAHSTTELARAVDPDIDAAKVVAGCGGNPLFALEAARSLSAGGSELSQTVTELIDERLARLAPAAHEVVLWAAAIGRTFGLELLQRVAAMETRDLLAAIEELERRRVIQPASREGYDFSHDLVRQVAYRRLSAPRRKVVHVHIARRLAEFPDPDGAFAADIAHHAQLGGDAELTARACAAAAAKCLRVFANRDAIELAGRGLHHVTTLKHLPREQRLALHLDLLRVYVHAGGGRRRMQEIEGELSRLILECQGAGVHALVSTGFHIIAFLHWLGGNFANAAVEAMQSVAASRSADPETTARALADSARCLAHLERDLTDAEALVTEADRMARHLGIELIDVPWARALLAFHATDYDKARTWFERTVFLARAAEYRWAECDALSRLAMIELEQRRYEHALERCRELAPVAQAMGEGSEAPFAAALEALAHYALQKEDADTKLAAALEDLRDVDNKQLLAYVLLSAAEIDERCQDKTVARVRAELALTNAEAVGAHKTVARARTALGLPSQTSTHFPTLVSTPAS